MNPPTDAEVERVADLIIKSGELPFSTAPSTVKQIIKFAFEKQLHTSQPPQVGSEQVQDAIKRLNRFTCVSEEAHAFLQVLLTALHQANERIAQLQEDKQLLDYVSP